MKRKSQQTIKSLVAIVFMAGFICNLMSCGSGTSKASLQNQVMASMQGKFETDSKYSPYKLTVKSVTLISTGSGAYKGIATIAYDGKDHDMAITVTEDKDNFMWQTESGAFSFLLGF
jgi:uncharacterized membrane protein YciS (DUF1049 family)